MCSQQALQLSTFSSAAALSKTIAQSSAFASRPCNSPDNSRNKVEATHPSSKAVCEDSVGDASRLATYRCCQRTTLVVKIRASTPRRLGSLSKSVMQKPQVADKRPSGGKLRCARCRSTANNSGRKSIVVPPDQHATDPSPPVPKVRWEECSRQNISSTSHHPRFSHLSDRRPSGTNPCLVAD